MWIDVKTGKPLGNAPPPVPGKTAQGEPEWHVWHPPQGGGDTWFNDHTGQNAAWDESKATFIDVKTGKALGKVPPPVPGKTAQGEPQWHVWHPPTGGGDTWFNDHTGQNAAWVPDKKKAGGGVRPVVAATAVAVGAAAIAAVIGIFVALNRGGGTSGDTGTPASVVQPAQSPPAATSTAAPATATASTGAARPLLTGTYSGTFAVADDPNGHASFIGAMPSLLQVNIGRDATTRVVTLQVSGDAPFIPVTSVGNYDETTGSFSASGSGDVTSQQIPVTATMDGTLIGGELVASLTFTGTPNGPISYEIDMTKIAGP